MPDGESCWPDVLRQPDDHMALRSLERPAVARGNTGLKPESHHHQQQGSQKGLPRTKLLDKPQPRIVGAGYSSWLQPCPPSDGRAVLSGITGVRNGRQTTGLSNTARLKGHAVHLVCQPEQGAEPQVRPSLSYLQDCRWRVCRREGEWKKLPDHHAFPTITLGCPLLIDGGT